MKNFQTSLFTIFINLKLYLRVYCFRQKKLLSASKTIMCNICSVPQKEHVDPVPKEISLPSQVSNNTSRLSSPGQTTPSKKALKVLDLPENFSPGALKNMYYVT